jgi:hypothetical protein
MAEVPTPNLLAISEGGTFLTRLNYINSNPFGDDDGDVVHNYHKCLSYGLLLIAIAMAEVHSI